MCHNSEHYKNRQTDRDAIWNVDSGGPKQPHTRWGSRSPTWMGNFEGKRGLVDTIKVNQKGAASARCICRFGCTRRGGAQWRHLVKMTEPSAPGGDAALCQINLTTCLFSTYARLQHKPIWCRRHFVFHLAMPRQHCTARVVFAVFQRRPPLRPTTNLHTDNQPLTLSCGFTFRSTKQVISETFPKRKWLSMEKLNLVQEKDTFTNQMKCTTTKNKHN